MRKDGGDYAADATLYKKKVEDLLDMEKLCGPMYKGDSDIPIFSWELATAFQDRKFEWDDSTTSDFEIFAMYLKGKLPKTEAVLDKYIRLYERGLLRRKMIAST